MKDKILSLLGLVSKAKYKALLASNDDWTQLCRDLSKENKNLNWHVDKNLPLVNSLNQTQLENTRLESQIKDLKQEINALNNLRASDQQTIKKLGKRKKMIYYTCGRLKREFYNQRDLAKHLNVSQFQVNYMLNGKIKNKYNIKRHER